ncbi:MAG: phosphoadenosine phosphosulfate reductase family protein [Prevotella sp.]|jgi:3'-phosphoadenosine 5'-phosphosulfate sulfotransferase (PAPS reductase)/FAD synthetase|nr:phosphoadenosine phosphosulfate reductase family protein [Prevotella sp.]
MVDYIMDEVQDDILVVQGIRGAESESRALMSSQCNYFKYYLEPYETNTTLLPKLERKLSAAKTQSNKDKILKRIEKVKQRLAIGKEDPKYHTYRRKEVLAYCKKYATDVLRPVFDKSAQWVVDYSLECGVDLNPLYRMGMGRVGCYPCILANLMEIHQIAVRTPERIDEVAVYEDEIGSSFFGPKKIPKKYYKGIAPTIREVVAYANGKYDAGELFDDFSPTSCMSFYGICE